MTTLMMLAQVFGLHGDELKPTLRDERGSVTIEKVLWAVAVIGIVAIVVAAITTFVNREASNIT